MIVFQSNYLDSFDRSAIKKRQTCKTQVCLLKYKHKNINGADIRIQTTGNQLNRI